MSLDITIKRAQRLVCPKCGELVGHKTIDEVNSGGRAWYELLEKFGYYVPVERRIEANDWYGKDMVLTKEQAVEMSVFAAKAKAYDANSISALVIEAVANDDDVMINADW